MISAVMLTYMICTGLKFRKISSYSCIHRAFQRLFFVEMFTSSDHCLLGECAIHLRILSLNPKIFAVIFLHTIRAYSIPNWWDRDWSPISWQHLCGKNLYIRCFECPGKWFQLIRVYFHSVIITNCLSYFICSLYRIYFSGFSVWHLFWWKPCLLLFSQG